jgi:KDO2-lipid IV(A) lauroyltransferase
MSSDAQGDSASSEPTEAGAQSTPAGRRARPRRAGHGPRSRPWVALLGRAALRIASWPSYRTLYHLGGWLGLAQFYLPGRSRSATRVNLRLCLPELDSAARKQLERASLIESGRTMLELGAIWGWDRERVSALMREVVGEDLLRDAHAEGRGVIMMTPHLGAWELCCPFLSLRYPFTCIYRPPNVLEMDAVYTRARERFGAKLVPADATGVRALHRAIHDGGLGGILPDQDPGRGSGIFVPFFGVPANTSVLVARLAAKVRAPVVFVWAERLPRGAGFRIHLERASSDVSDPDVELATRALNRDVERLVRRLPEQYLWSYKRFRYRPPGESSPYKETASDE